MIRGAAAVPLLLGAAVASCAILILEAVAGRDISWMLELLPVVAFLAGRAPAWPAGVPAVALLAIGIAVSQLIDFDGDDIVPEVMLPSALYLAGLALHSREALAGRLAAQADELEAERDAYARLSVRYERARIAAELHDIVAHAISVMVVQASAGQRLATHQPSRAAETFGVIATASRQAQADLDRLADLLAQDIGPHNDTDLSLVQAIVDTARDSGLPVTLHVAGDTSTVSATIAHAALRVIQEGLTNALRYAPGAAVEVSVEARPRTLELSVVNGSPTTTPRLGLGSGRGLTGLRERLSACGGTLDVGPTDGGGWSMHARIAY